MIRRLLGLNLTARALKVAEAQRKIAASWQQIAESRERELEIERLGMVRHTRSLIEQFLIALDQPEEQDALRIELIAAMLDLNDEVARREEQVV